VDLPHPAVGPEKVDRWKGIQKEGRCICERSCQGTGMPLSGWMDEWYGSIEREFGLAVKHSSTIELQCPPEHRDRDGLWQKMREVTISDFQNTSILIFN
jgi:hypothetical protein